jgi:tRNA(Arg) A34 adenosine deaminase TadA
MARSSAKVSLRNVNHDPTAHAEVMATDKPAENSLVSIDGCVL